jgi:urocanate hydratase
LIVYGGREKLQEFQALNDIIASLKVLEMMKRFCQSGKPVAILKRIKTVKSTDLEFCLFKWANWEHFDELEKLMMYNQMTANRIYIARKVIFRNLRDLCSCGSSLAVFEAPECDCKLGNGRSATHGDRNDEESP